MLPHTGLLWLFLSQPTVGVTGYGAGRNPCSDSVSAVSEEAELPIAQLWAALYGVFTPVTGQMLADLFTLPPLGGEGMLSPKCTHTLSLSLSLSPPVPLTVIHQHRSHRKSRVLDHPKAPLHDLVDGSESLKESQRQWRS